MKNQSYSGLMSVYCKENESLLKKSFLSILNQTIIPNEFVCVMDGPLGKNLLNVIHEFKLECNKLNINLKIVKNEKNLGLGMSLAKGIQFCSNSLIARFDSDDINDSKRMEMTLKFLEQNPEVDVLGGQILEFVNDIDEVTGKRFVPSNNNEIITASRIRNPMNHMTVTFKKKSVLDAGNYIDMPAFEDYYLWMRMLNNGAILHNLPEVLVRAHTDANTYSRRTGLKYFQKELHFQKKIYKDGIINKATFLRNVCTRCTVRILPPKLLKFIYKIIR